MPNYQCRFFTIAKVKFEKPFKSSLLGCHHVVLIVSTKGEVVFRRRRSLLEKYQVLTGFKIWLQFHPSGKSSISRSPRIYHVGSWLYCGGLTRILKHLAFGWVRNVSPLDDSFWWIQFMFHVSYRGVDQVWNPIVMPPQRQVICGSAFVYCLGECPVRCQLSLSTNRHWRSRRAQNFSCFWAICCLIVDWQIITHDQIGQEMFACFP